MIKAGVLLYSLAIALLIALLSSSIILFSFFTRTAIQKNSTIEKLQLNANSAIQLMLAAPSKVPLDSPTKIDLFGDGNDSVTLIRKFWGGFEISIAISGQGRLEEKRAAMIGSTLHHQSKVSLYLADSDKPLSLCGKTIIKGICFLPKGEVKRAYIEGQNFMGDKLIDGEIKESDKDLPEVNKEMIENNIAYLSGQFNKTDSIVNFEKIIDSIDISRSFSANTLLIKSKEKIELTKQNFTGNIIVASDKGIFVGKGCSLGNIIIYAPFIELENYFTGSVQLFASDSLFIGENSNLKYPSVAGLISSGEGVSKIHFKKNAELSGVAFSYRKKIDNRIPFGFFIDEGTNIRGEVYSNGPIDLKGNVFGSLTCQNFILSTPSAVYENHLLNVTIDYSLLSKHFAGINLTGNSENRKIVKWLF